MSGYVARKYDNGDDIKMILSNLKMLTLENPEALDSMIDDVEKDIYREDVKEYVKYKCALSKSSKRIYSLVLGQCTESLQAKMKEKEEWKEIDEKSDSVELLKRINEIVFKVDTGKNIYMTTRKVKWESANPFQNNEMLEWQPKPGPMQGGAIQRDNHLEFAQHNEQGNRERTAKIYKKIKRTNKKI